MFDDISLWIYNITFILSNVILFPFKKENPFLSSNKIYDTISEEILFEMIFLIGIHSMQGWTATTSHRSKEIIL